VKLEITDEAVKWFKNEVDLDDGDTIKFFAQYGGDSTVQSGFSLAFEPYGSAITTGASTEKEGITFFIEEGDLWYFDGHDLKVAYDKDSQEITFNYGEPDKE
jgi:uncharacterized protein YneR